MSNTEHTFIGRKTLVLTMAEVKRLLSVAECIDLQRIAFMDHARGTGFNAPSSWLRVNKHQGWIKMLAGFVDSTDAMGIKVLARYPNNPPGMNLGSLLVLFEATNGFPLAICDGVYVTAVRTGAGAGLATLACARPNSRIVGVLGSGVVARYSLLAICHLMPQIQRVLVYSRNSDRRARFARRLFDETGVEVEPVTSPEAAVTGADIIITGTNTQQPSLYREWLQPGMHVNAMGIRQEIHPDVFRDARIYGDSREVAIDDGKFGIALQAGAVAESDLNGEIGEVLLGQQPGRSDDSEITIFDSSGLAIQDVICAYHIYTQAQVQGVGTEVDLGLADSP